jgi:hypothetical protein
LDTKSFEPLNRRNAVGEERPAVQAEVAPEVEVASVDVEKQVKENQDPIKEVKIKQAVIDVPRSKTVKLKVPGFRGGFKSMKFGDDHITENVVSAEEKADFVRQFPRAVVEEVEE